MAAMYWACADLLALASQLAQGAVPSSGIQLRTNLAVLFEQMRSKGAEAGIIPEDLADASYALMALFDEILVQVNWPGRAEWQARPLQFEHFHENTAGENFFRRAEIFSQQPHRAHVVQIYFICLSLGFQGRYAMGQVAELESFQRRISAMVSGSTLSSETLSPHGVPPDAGRSILGREAPIARLGLACLLAALVVFCLLLVARTMQLSHALEPMRAYRNAPPELPGKT
jgi:type VI secretion system protein ImpK